jgi:hypothetical protein
MVNKGPIPCPGGCGNSIHANAAECPHCGYRPDFSRLEDLLGSLSTMSSILTGFGLAALVQLATSQAEPRNDWLSQLTNGMWILSSVLLLGVMIGAEFLRRRELRGSRMCPAPQDDERLWQQSERLLAAFTFALALTAAGVISLGFSFSALHGILGCIAVGVGLFLISR